MGQATCSFSSERDASSETSLVERAARMARREYRENVAAALVD